MKLFIGLFVLSFSCIQASSLLVDGSFETPPVTAGLFTLYGSGGNIGGAWTVTGATCGTNCVLAIEKTYNELSGSITFEAEDGSVALDLSGAGNTVDGGVSQTVATTAGQLYSLSFWVGNMDDAASNYNQPSSVRLLINSVPINVYTNSNSTSGLVNWQQFVFSFVATASTTVEFQNATTGDNYAGLDNVSLDLTAVPEPTSLALSGFAMIGVAAVLRRKARRS